MKIRQFLRLKRYFLVVYSTKLDNGNIMNGFLTQITPNGGYVNVDNIKEHMEKQYKNCTIIIQNIIELNKLDFKSFTEHNIINSEK